MNKFITFIFILLLAGIGLLGYADNPHFPSDSTKKKKEEKKKKGFNFGPLPVLGYNSDIGFQYGLVLHVFNYGDGTLYPEYKYSIYTEVSRTTKGGGINQLFFDSKHLLPHNIRITADISYLTELALNFYGFNGYESVYNRSFEDDKDPDYKSRMFYRHERKFFRFTLDLQGKLKSDKILWLGGLGYFDTKVSTVNIDKLNKGKDESEKLPDTALLYDEYVSWGLLKENEKNGGATPYLKAGVIYDSRDNEPNPNKGIWSELLLFYSPKILGNDHYSYLKLAITHRHYIPIVKNKLTLAYRLGYQGTLAGDVPFYMQPYMISSFSKVTTTDGLGGAKNLRGILRNRIVGDHIAFGNIELRWKFYNTVIWKQNVYLALNGFVDGGRVIKEINIEFKDGDQPDNAEDYFSNEKETMHWAGGGGFRIGVNQNFIIAIDYGRAFDRRDGKDGIYVGIGYLF